jgi:hypothetical protein
MTQDGPGCEDNHNAVVRSIVPSANTAPASFAWGRGTSLASSRSPDVTTARAETMQRWDSAWWFILAGVILAVLALLLWGHPE